MWAPQRQSSGDLRRLGGVLALDGLLLLVVLVAANPPTKPEPPLRIALAPVSGPGPLRAAQLFAGLAPQSPPLNPTDLPDEGPLIALAPRPPGRETLLRPDPTPLIASAGGPPEPPEFRPELARPTDAPLADAPLLASAPSEDPRQMLSAAALTPTDLVPASSADMQREDWTAPAAPASVAPSVAEVAFQPQRPVPAADASFQVAIATDVTNASVLGKTAPVDGLAGRIAQPPMALQEDLTDALMLVSLNDSWEWPDAEPAAAPSVTSHLAKPPADPLAADPQKDQFVNALMPLIAQANSRILADREHLLHLAADTKARRALSDEDAQFLARLREEYHAPQGGLDELLRRVDVVPPSLAIAQAAQESGWGALKEPQGVPRSLFGQMVERRLAHFDDATSAVAAYIGNLNSHNAYGEFRAERARLRAAGREIEGQTLVSYIQRYSERGMDYVNSVKGLIDWNKLGTYDRARWDDRVAGTTRD